MDRQVMMAAKGVAAARGRLGVVSGGGAGGGEDCGGLPLPGAGKRAVAGYAR